MGRQPESSPVIEIVLDKTATREEVEGVKAAFEDAGLPAEKVRAGIEFKSVDLPPWVIVVTVSTAGIFFSGFVAAAGADAWKGLRDLVARLYRARESRGRKGSVTVRFTEEREEVVFVDGLPDAAFRELVQIEIVHTEYGQLRWDAKTQSWRDTMDVARES